MRALNFWSARSDLADWHRAAAFSLLPGLPFEHVSSVGVCVRWLLKRDPMRQGGLFSERVGGAFALKKVSSWEWVESGFNLHRDRSVSAQHRNYPSLKLQRRVSLVALSQQLVARLACVTRVCTRRQKIQICLHGDEYFAVKFLLQFLIH